MHRKSDEKSITLVGATTVSSPLLVTPVLPSEGGRAGGIGGTDLSANSTTGGRGGSGIKSSTYDS